MNKLHLIGTAVLAGVMVAGCSKENEPGVVQAADEYVAPSNATEVAVSVNDTKLTFGEISKRAYDYIKSLGDKVPAENLGYMRAQVRQNLAQGFIVEHALYDYAASKGFLVTDDDRKAAEEKFIKNLAGRPDAPKSLEEFAEKAPIGKEEVLKSFDRGIVIDKLFESELGESKTNFEAQAKEMIAEIEKFNADQPKMDEAALKKIQELQAELGKPTVTNVPVRFAELAREFSDCPSGKRAGGDLDFFTHGQMVKEFDAVAFTQEVGKVSAPVKTQFGYHLILVTDKKAAVEAKGDQPAEPESVRASHILIRGGEKRPVPTMENVIQYLRNTAMRDLQMKLIQKAVQEAKTFAVPEFQGVLDRFLPPPAEPVKVPVEKAAEAKNAKNAEKAN